MEANNIIIIQGEEEKSKSVRYEINPSQEPIGKGGTGVVRIGVMVDDRTGIRRDVAIKFLYDDMPANILVRSQREASIHILSENLVEMIDFVQVNEQDAQGRTIVHSHVVSELLHGVMLLDILKGITTDKDGNEVHAAREFYSLMMADRSQFAMKIVRSVLSGIQALHDNGYIHRDIDPSNIMITDRGKVKLIDLGIAKKTNTMGAPEEQHLTSTGQFIGKAAYAAPELVLGDLANQNETTDIYAIGVMLYLLVVGKLPFNGPLQEILHQQCTEKMPVQNIKDKNIRKIVKKATEKRQSERYQSAAEFRVAVDAVTRQMKPAKIAPVPTNVTTGEPQTSSKVVSSMPESGTVVSSMPAGGTVVSSISESETVISDVPESGTIVSVPVTKPVAKPDAVVTPSSIPSITSKNHTLLYIYIAAAAIVAIAILMFVFAGKSPSAGEGGGEPATSSSEMPVQESTSEPAGPSSTMESAPVAPAQEATSEPTETKPEPAQVENTMLVPTNKAETAKADKSAPAAKSAAAKSAPVAKTGNGIKLSYGTYSGPVKNGYPNGKGKLVYSTSRRINKYDPKGIVAQPGEYVEGLFVNGFLTVGKHYSASGELLNKISAGVAEGVYESK